MNWMTPNIRFPVGKVVDYIVDLIMANFSVAFRAASSVLIRILGSTVDLLRAVPPPVLMLALALIVWRLAGRKLAVLTLGSLVLMYGLNLWDRTLDTLVMVLVSTVLAIAISIPLGVFAAWSERYARGQRVVLDFMQTLPAFVYLVPAVMLFGMGRTSAIFATLVFATPPPIRFIHLGLREVSKDLVEAGQAFGCTRLQLLLRVQIPAALPTIMGGINQCIMMSLSMVVIASMIGAGGLGGEVLRAIQTVNVGLAFEAGLAVVLMAIIFDRTVQSLKDRYSKLRGGE